ncbi:DUF58 domain-containing protein [Xanthovirga aplysinae]|uniref:DUF58 domain-containing protein n=1 Tax=Xanthovirga aplysinae TaxID=2529853 RepID=UPI0012BB7ED4|nr:DUF58 domain-containing protein [Xanthovirga aplysinae]MTI32709.1 DUF58 domain-containing protein [Xanthovirga aplysinae]
MKELIKKLRNYEIRIRKAINSHRHGNFRSVFKGSGLEFDDVRSYQYGDDVRSIDWKVTAKGHGTFVKTYKEEREQSIYFILDVSASQEIGAPNKQKIDVGREICGVLALSALKESSQVGVIGFSDQLEMYLRSGKGHRHAAYLLKNLFELKSKSKKTSIRRSIQTALKLIKKRSVVFLISDFIDKDYEQPLKALIRKHDVVIIHLSDRRETQLPKLGIIPVLDKESGKTLWVNTSSEAYQKQYGQMYMQNSIALDQFCRSLQANYVDIDTEEDYVPKLIKLFKIRNKSKGKSVHA